jgi:hypothetical protein
MYHEAIDEAELRTQASYGNATTLQVREKRTPYGLHQLLVRERNYKTRALHKRTSDDHAEFGVHFGALLRTQSADVSRNLAVHAMASFMHLRSTWDAPFAHFTDAASTSTLGSVATADPVIALEARRTQLGLRLAMHHAGAYMQRVSAGLGRLQSRPVSRCATRSSRRRRRRRWHSTTRRSA